MREWWAGLRILERLTPWWNEQAEAEADEIADRAHLRAIANRILGERARSQSRDRIEAVATKRPARHLRRERTG